MGTAFGRNARSRLDAGGMSIARQPIVDLATGEMVSVEAPSRFAAYPYTVEGRFRARAPGRLR